jgi:hypothetical protein
MQLSFRGLKYEIPASHVSTSESEIVARYRGNTYKLRWCIEVPKQPLYELKYRGTSYRSAACPKTKDSISGYQNNLAIS